MLAPIADAYREWGIVVFPLRGKRPVCASWKAPPEIIPPRATGLGIVMGTASGGLMARDFDQEDAFHEWADENPDLAAVLPIVRTRRGFHVYARAHEPVATRTFDDGELKAEGAYVVAPPSLHPEGGTYRWVQPMTRFIPIIDPTELLLPGQVLRAEKTHKQSPLTHNCSSLPGGFSGGLTLELSVLAQTDKRGFVGQAIAMTLPTGHGMRNRKLFELAMILRLGLDPETSEAELEAIVRDWHGLALPNIKTRKFGKSWEDFKAGWQYADPHRGFKTYLLDRYAGAGFWVDTGDDGLNKVYRVFVIAESYGGEGSTFFLGSRDVASIVGTSQSTANRQINELRKEGLVIEAIHGTWAHKGEGRKASCWTLPRLETSG